MPIIASKKAKYIVGLLLSLLTTTANAQSVQQSGNVTPGHAACWAITGVVYDCGAPGGGVSVVGSTTTNDFVAFNSSGSLIDSGINPTSTSSWSGLQNFNGGATAPTRPPGDSTTNVATTAFVTNLGLTVALPPATGVASVDTAAIQAAINALPADGGTLVAPCGGINYNINATINIGNGTSSSITTKNGVFLVGVCAAPSYSLDTFAGWPSGRFSGAQFIWSGSAGGTMFSVNGGDGWGFSNIVINCNNSAGTGLLVTSAENGASTDLTILDCTMFGYSSTTVPNFGGVFKTDSLRNKFWGLFVAAPPGAIGVALNGENSVGNANTDFNEFHTTQVTSRNSGSGVTAFYIANADSNILFNTTCTMQKSTDVCIHFDYAGISPGLPSANVFQFIDWGSATTNPVVINGSCGGRVNFVLGVLGANAAVPVFGICGVLMTDNSVQQGGGQSFQSGLVNSLQGFTVNGPNGIMAQNLFFSGGWKYFANGMGSVQSFPPNAGFYSNNVAAINAGGANAAATLIDAYDVFQDGSVTFNHNVNIAAARLAQGSTAAANVNGYLQTNSTLQADSMNLNPGLSIYDGLYGMDLGWVSGVYRTRIYAGSTSAIAFASVASSPTSQSSFTEYGFIDSNGINMKAFNATGAAPTGGAGITSLGNGTVAAGTANCPSGNLGTTITKAITGCIIMSVGGTARNIPFVNN